MTGERMSIALGAMEPEAFGVAEILPLNLTSDVLRARSGAQ